MGTMFHFGSTVSKEFASEMVVKCIKSNYKICEIPINLFNNGFNRKPHLRSLRDGLRHVNIIVKLKIKK